MSDHRRGDAGATREAREKRALGMVEDAWGEDRHQAGRITGGAAHE